MAFEEMYQEILQSGKGKPVYNRIRSMIHKTWENQENQKKLKEMGLDFGGKIPTNREFVCTMVEYIKILESKSEQDDPELLEWIGWDGIVIKTHKKQVFQGSSRPNKTQLIKAIVEYIKWLQEA